MSDNHEEEGKQLQVSLDKLADWEKEMNQVEKDAEIYRMKKTQPIRSILKTVPKFWYIILAENEDFTDYISPEDLKFLEFIEDIYVYYPIINGEADHFRDFDLTITFGENSLIPQQEITKKFRTVVKYDGEERLVSEPVEVQWPKELTKINPVAIKEKYKGKDKKEMSLSEKKKYREGMRSFFSFFNWTGEKPGKEFRYGEEIANLIVDDLYLNALKYYILALSDEGDEEEEIDSSEGEELDLSDDDEEEEENPTKKRKL
ncbi:VPS75 Vacuolar protein sorting-associated protein 75 [Candida maltosa Xu316]